MYLLLACLCFASLCLSKPVNDIPKALSEEENDANEFIDAILEVARIQYKDKLEPFKLPDMTAGFSRKIWPITWHGKAELWSGSLSGATSIRRTGDCKIDQGEDHLGAEVRLGLDNLKFQYQARVSFMGLGPKVTAYGDIRHIDIDAHVKLEGTANGIDKGKPKVHRFNLHKFDGFVVKFSGLGPLNFVANLISRAVVAIAQGRIKNTIATKVTEVIENIMDSNVMDEFLKPNY